MPRRPETTHALDRPAFIALLIALSLAFAWVVAPFYGAVFWGSVLALLFEPLHRRFLRRFGGDRRTPAALATVGVILVIVILPLCLIALSMVREGTALYQRVASGEMNFGRYFQQILAALPSWATSLLSRLGLDDIASLQARVTTAVTERGQSLAGRVFNVGQDVLDLVIGFGIAMYLLFFLLRDGVALVHRIREAIPLADRPKALLLERFTTVVRATVKGNVLVALAQGALGGLAFWFLDVRAAMLWAVVMAFLSLLPAVGAALIWGPVAIYLLAIGQTWQGVGLIVYGVLVIGLVDNVLRPILVGKDIHLPDYLVLISTIGGIAVLGLNGFVIGPLIAAMFVTAWQILAEERRTGDPA